MPTDRSPLCPEVLERLGVDGRDPAHSEPAHLAAAPHTTHEPDAGCEPASAHVHAVVLDGTTPYER